MLGGTKCKCGNDTCKVCKHRKVMRAWRIKKLKAKNWMHGKMHAFEVSELEKIRYKKPVRNDGSYN